MPSYRVTWTIDIDNDDINTHVQAAELALHIMRDPESIATVFEVAEDGGDNARQIDLGEEHENQ